MNAILPATVYDDNGGVLVGCIKIVVTSHPMAGLMDAELGTCCGAPEHLIPRLDAVIEENKTQTILYPDVGGWSACVNTKDYRRVVAALGTTPGKAA